MASISVLRIPAEDSEPAFILAQVTSAGSKTLDVKLVATEGQAPYTVKLKHKNIEQLRSSNSPASPDEWETILTAVLYNRESVDGVEAVAKINDAESLDITIRRRVEGINQKLGSITLRRKDDEGIDTLDWCSEAVLGRERAKAELAAAVASATELEAAVAELKDQLEELIQAKKSEENEMLEKFRNLLNEKKVKIREQQQLLLMSSGAGLRPQGGITRASQEIKEEPESTPVPEPKRGRRQVASKAKPAVASRPKRKAAQAALNDDNDESDDDFQKMEVDPKPDDAEDNLSEDQRTTDDDATGSDSDDEVAPAPTLSAMSKSKVPGAAQAEKPKELPPVRALPFSINKKPVATSSKSAAPPPAGSDTGSDDDDDDDDDDDEL